MVIDRAFAIDIEALIPENFGMIGTFLEDLVNLCPDDKILKRLIIDLEAELGTNEEDTNFLSKLETVSYTHLTLPTKA